MRHLDRSLPSRLPSFTAIQGRSLLSTELDPSPIIMNHVCTCWYTEAHEPEAGAAFLSSSVESDMAWGNISSLGTKPALGNRKHRSCCWATRGDYENTIPVSAPDPRLWEEQCHALDSSEVVQDSEEPCSCSSGYCHLVNVVTTSLKGHSTILSSHVPRMSREEDIECLSTGKTRKLQMGCFWLSYGQEWRKSFLANQRGLEQD